MRAMRKVLIAAAVALAALTGIPAVAPVNAAATSGTAAATPYCGIRWGSLVKQDEGLTTAPITNLRVGRHRCFDRLVVDLGTSAPVGPGQRPGYRVEYVRQVVQDGSGRPQPLDGAADLSVVVGAPAHDVAGRPTYRPVNRVRAVNVTGFTTFRQVAFLGTFEGQTTIGLGVRARLPFRVFVLAGPGSGSRLVIDVAHRW
jgi:hypothetical protein